MPRLLIANCIAAWLLTATGVAVAQDMAMPGAALGMEQCPAPVTQYGEGSFFSQELGTILRLRYNTESYGQNQHGNFDIGTMQVLTLDDSLWFFDGQVTVNDVQGTGFNLGVGYRWMTSPPYSEAGRVEGVSVWADGTHTGEGNFFPQLGLSWESLGEMWDVRANGYIPIGQQDQVGKFQDTGVIGFFQNSIAQLTQAVVDSSFTVGELEVARRMGPERDAWAFAGPYFVANDDDDSAGVRAGLRGYAYPDLLLQVAVSNDEIFDTNATFSVVWFVGRTRTDYQPACGVADRMREPVMRNDYVVLAQSFVAGGIPLTEPDGTALRVVHVDSTAAPGGDGTFENPYNMLSQINGAGSQAGDIIFAHAESIFTGDMSAILKNDQRLLGEGDGFEHMVVTAEEGTILIPESSPGARNADRPMIVDALGDAILLANDNEVANFDFEGGTGSAIAGTNLTGDAILHDLAVRNGADFGISLTNIATTSFVSLDQYTYDGGTTGGGIELNNFDGFFSAANGTLTNGNKAGVRVTGGSDGTFNFDSTFTLDSVDNATGAAFEIDGFTGALTMNGTIDNDVGRAVSIQNMSLAGTTVTFSATADITHSTTGANAEGVFIANNTAGTVAFNGDLMLTTDGSIAFNANEANHDVTLTASSTNNTIDTTNAAGLQVVGTNIGATGANFSVVNASGGTNGIVLTDNTGGPVTVGTLGDNPPDGGLIANTTGHAIVIENSANATVSGVRINNTSAVSGVRIVKDTTGTQTVNLNDLEVNNGDFGVEVMGNGTGTLNMTVNDTNINGSNAFGLSFDNIDSGTIQVNGTTLDGNNANAAAVGLRILDSNASFTFDSQTIVREWGTTDFEVSGGTGTISFAGDIVNSNAANALDTTGRSVRVHDVTGGSVTFTATSSINDDNLGMLIQNNTGGTFTFLGDNVFNTGAADAVTIVTNTGATISLGGLNIDTTGGRGLVATGGGTLTTLGTTNTIDTTTGVGLDIEDMTIGAGGVSFQSVSVNGAANGIVLRNLIGAGQVSIGNAGGLQNSGGVLKMTTGDAIVIQNVANVDLRHIQIDGAGGQGVNIDHTAAATTTMDVTILDLNLDASTGTGISVLGANTNTFNLRLTDSDLEENVAMSSTGSGAFRLLVDNNDITTAGTDIAFSLAFSGSTQDGDVTIRNGNNFSAFNAKAFDLTVNGTNADVEFLLDNNVFTNTSAASETAEIVVDGGATLNANIVNNSFTNALAADEFAMTSDGSTTRINLNLDNNTSSGVYELTTANNGGGFNFGVVDRDNTNANNTGTVNFNPLITDFEDIPGPVEMPTVP